MTTSSTGTGQLDSGAMGGDSAETEIIQLSPAAKAREARQSTRKTDLKRFNWLYVYLPLTIGIILVVTLFGLITWAALFNDGVLEQGQASGVADTFVTLLCLLPMTLIFLLLPAAGGYALYWRRNKGSVVRKHVANLAGKAESGLDTADEKLREQQPRIVDGTIKVRQKVDGTLDKIATTVLNLTQSIDRRMKGEKQDES